MKVTMTGFIAPGRPALGTAPSVRWHVHLPPELHEAAEAAAAAAGLTKSEWLRTLITDRVTRP